MDERVLRSGVRDLEAVAPDPAFVERLHEQLLAEAGYRASVAPGTDAPADVRHGPRPARRAPMRLLLAAAVPLVAAGAIVAAAAVAERLAPRPDLFASLHRTGRVDVVVPDGPPQVALPRGGWTGLDVDAARLIVGRLGLEASVDVAPGGVPSPGAAWDLAVLAGPPAEDAPPPLLSEPFAWWPERFVVSEGVPGRDLDASAGARVCAVAGTDAERWLRGDALRDAIALRERPPVTLVVGADDAGCQAALANGSVDGIISGRSLADLQVDASLAPTGDAVLLVPRRIAVRDQPGAATLRDALDRVIAGTLTDGAMADISRRRLGGEDITGIPRASARP